MDEVVGDEGVAELHDAGADGGIGFGFLGEGVDAGHDFAVLGFFEFLAV